MRALLKSRLTLPALLIAVLFLIVACGSAATATPRPQPTQPPPTEAPAASDGEAMESEEGESMEGESMEGEAMDGEAMEDDKMSEDGDAMAMESGSLSLKLTGIQPLANGYHYEGWAIVDGSPVTTGKFNVDANGGLVDLSGAPIADGVFKPTASIEGAAAIVITIEPAGDVDTVPATTKYLGGNLADGSASLSVAHGSSLGDDFSAATGVYILATPTDGPDNNERSGIWFLDLPSGPGPGLELPVLPDGWLYEGWVVIDGTPVSTGRFSAVDAPDLDAPYSGDLGAPPVPGEDFIANAPDGLTFPTDIAGMTAVISVEPAPDDSAAPFTLKPLVGAIPASAADHVNYSLDNNAQGFPAGTATIG